MSKMALGCGLFLPVFLDTLFFILFLDVGFFASYFFALEYAHSQTHI